MEYKWSYSQQEGNKYIQSALERNQHLNLLNIGLLTGIIYVYYYLQDDLLSYEFSELNMYSKGEKKNISQTL